MVVFTVNWALIENALHSSNFVVIIFILSFVWSPSRPVTIWLRMYVLYIEVNRRIVSKNRYTPRHIIYISLTWQSYHTIGRYTPTGAYIWCFIFKVKFQLFVWCSEQTGLNWNPDNRKSRKEKNSCSLKINYTNCKICHIHGKLKAEKFNHKTWTKALL